VVHFLKKIENPKAPLERVSKCIEKEKNRKKSFSVNIFIPQRGREVADFRGVSV